MKVPIILAYLQFAIGLGGMFYREYSFAACEFSLACFTLLTGRKNE